MTDPTFLLALAAAILSGASIVLHIVAPRTKNTVDDRIVAGIDEVLAILRPPTPAIVPGSPADLADQMRRGVAKFGGPAGALALVVLAIAGSSCTPAQRTTAGHAVVDCTAANASAIGGTLAAMRAKPEDGGCAAGTGTNWDCVQSKAIANGVVVGGCAFLELISAELSPVARVASATGEPPPERAGRAAFESYRASIAGGATFRTMAGDR